MNLKNAFTFLSHSLDGGDHQPVAVVTDLAGAMSIRDQVQAWIDAHAHSITQVKDALDGAAHVLELIPAISAPVAAVAGLVDAATAGMGKPPVVVANEQ
jgi:hypothetical protein